jgi:hypothetical protein
MGSMMNIHSIHTLQGLQNAVRPAGEVKPAPSSGPLPKVASLDSDTSPEESVTPLGQSAETSALISSGQRDLESDPTVVRYPPFFPIATYQRLDLIEKTKGMEDKLQESSPGESIPSTSSDNFLKSNGTETETSTANGEIFAFSDQSTGRAKTSLDEKQPGSILNIEV